jgi:hypothetical protein
MLSVIKCNTPSTVEEAAPFINSFLQTVHGEQLDDGSITANNNTCLRDILDRATAGLF